MNKNFSDVLNFLLSLDGLKTIDRKTYINGGERLENSAEHSWHLAMACWAFSEMLEEDFDTGKLFRLALVHDLGEIGAGDTYLYSQNRELAHLEERRSLLETAEHPGNPITKIVELWDEQEAGKTKEARLLKVIDRLLPFLHNMASEGKAWRDHGIHKQQVLAMHQFIESDMPEIYAWLEEQVNFAVTKGWLIEDLD